MEVKINKRDLHPVAKGIEGIFAEYEKLLGSHNPFSQFQLGAGFYVWSLPDSGNWTKLTDAPADEAQRVRQLMLERKNEVAAKANQATADKLFTVPTDEFVYYDLSGSEPQLKLTAWAFKWPARNNLMDKEIRRQKAHPVSVAFTYDGTRLPNYPFKIKNRNKLEDRVTGTDGLCTFPSVQPGNTLFLHDDNTGKDHELLVDVETSVHEFDVTEYTDVSVKVSQDGQPVAGEDVKLNYKNHSYTLQTDADGLATFSVPYFDGETATANVRDEIKSQAVSNSTPTIEFNFETPVVAPPHIPEEKPEEPEEPAQDPKPEPEPELINLTVLRTDGRPMANATLTLRQEGHPDQTMRTADDGSVHFAPAIFNFGQPISVTITDGTRNIDPVELTLDEGEYDYELHEQEPAGSNILGQILAIMLVAGLSALTWFGLEKVFPLLPEHINI